MAILTRSSTAPPAPCPGLPTDDDSFSRDYDRVRKACRRSSASRLTEALQWSSHPSRERARTHVGRQGDRRVTRWQPFVVLVLVLALGGAHAKASPFAVNGLIAFERYSAVGPTQIWVMNQDGSGQ